MSKYELNTRKVGKHPDGAGVKRKTGLDWHLAVASLVTVALLNWPTAAQASDGSVLESQGTVVRTEIGPITTRISDTGRVRIVLPSAPKSRTVALAQGTVNVGNDSLVASAGQASAAARNRRTNAQAYIADLNLFVGATLVIKADLIKADTRAQCNARGRAVVNGNSIIKNLRINNRLVSSQTAFPPNTVIEVPGVPGVKLVVNAQDKAARRNMGEITVTALRLKIDPVGGLLPPVSDLLPIDTSTEVVISEARSDVNCR